MGKLKGEALVVEHALHDDRRIHAHRLHVIQILGPQLVCPVGGGDVVGDFVDEGARDGVLGVFYGLFSLLIWDYVL